MNKPNTVSPAMLAAAIRTLLRADKDAKLQEEAPTSERDGKTCYIDDAGRLLGTVMVARLNIRSALCYLGVEPTKD